ncbi:ABC transporter permease [Desulfoplanes sp.]
MSRKGEILPPAFIVCLRELRHGVRGFGVFLACLILGVFAITGVGTFSESAKQGVLTDARSIMGGDVEVLLTSRRMSGEQLGFFTGFGKVSVVAGTRTMAGIGDKAALVELKGVDADYPLYGQVGTRSGIGHGAVLGREADVPVCLVEPLLLDRLGVHVGETIRVGGMSFRIGGVLVYEPDRVVQAFSLGPRVMVDLDDLTRSGIAGPGNLVRYRYRVRMADGDPKELVALAKERFPDAGWAIRDYSRAAPNIRRLLERLDVNLSLIGLAALLVGGLGISGAVRGYIGKRIERIAVMKCVGGTGGVLLWGYLLQILLLGALGSGIGMVLGAMVPTVAVMFFSDVLPVTLRTGVYVEPMVRAGLFGICTTMAFCSGTLVRAVRVSPATLFRGYVDQDDGSGLLSKVLPGLFSALLIVLVLLFTENTTLACGFILGTIGCFFLFALAARLLCWVVARVPPIPCPWVRLGLGQIVRPGAPTTSLVFALGLGLTCLVAVALVNVNLTRALTRDVADETPSFFFMDIQQHETDRFMDVVGGITGPEDLSARPVIRGRIMKIAGKNVGEVGVDPEVSWAVRGDRMLTYAGAMPEDTVVAQGTWWDEEYDAEPLISLTSDLARGFGVGLGDTLTVNVLGRNITATIANIRDVDWTTLAMQFAIIFAPGTLDRAPGTTLAAVRATRQEESRIFNTVSELFPTVAIIRVGDVLDHVGSLFSRMALVFQTVSALALVSGFLVLAGAFSADQHRRIYDAVIYKVCGATRRDIVLALVTEFAVIGFGAGSIGCLTGILAAWGVIAGFMNMRFAVDPVIAVATVVSGVILAVGLGLMGTIRALGKKPAGYLRNE